ncbi:MAG: hypothetical protein IJT94_08145 [Oscillibacter sp.]|nr:hypothetical protein [Oscillibacter sp.]
MDTGSQKSGGKKKENEAAIEIHTRRVRLFNQILWFSLIAGSVLLPLLFSDVALRNLGIGFAAASVFCALFLYDLWHRGEDPLKEELKQRYGEEACYSEIRLASHPKGEQALKTRNEEAELENTAG